MAPDLILVDGRFRVAAALESLPRMRSDAKLVVHDFWNCEQYQVILPFFECVDRTDTLAVFRRKEELRLVGRCDSA